MAALSHVSGLPEEPTIASLAQLSLSSDEDRENLCEVCKLLDLHKVFLGDESYTLPVTKANPFGTWHNQFCWFLSHLRSASGCAFCSLILQTLCLSHDLEKLESGIVTGRRKALYSKEKDASLPSLYFLTLAISDDDELRPPKETGYAITVEGKHEMKVPNSMDAVLKHFYPYLPPGMVPFSTTDEQAKVFDVWREETGTEYEVSIRKFDTGQVNLEMVISWIRKCEDDHAAWCRAKGVPSEEIPGFRVIDVKAGMIVDAPPQCRYLALSYVWGRVHQDKEYLSLREENLAILGEIGALFAKTNSLPDTIKDAISLCQKLDERYLWVDSLCIIQDSLDDKMNQISKMDTIYRRALLTVVAAAGSDANAGLPGLRPPLPRKSTPSAKIGSLDLVALPTDGEADVNASTWNSRAWTFQERILSTRLLRFTATSVTFECQEACWREDLELQGEGCDQFRLVENDRQEQETRQNFHQIISDDEVLDFEKLVPREKYLNVFGSLFKGCYAPLVGDYTKRQLTEKGDMLNAFQGIEAALSKSLGPFHWGAPQHLLAQSISWISKTRELSTREGFPSWSWAGWMFEDGNHASFPTTIHGPYPGFVIYSDEGEMLYWNEDCLKDPYLGIYDWNDRLLIPEDLAVAKEWDVILHNTVEDAWNLDDGIRLSSLLFFWTSTAPIRVEKNDEDGRANAILKGSTVIRSCDEGILIGGQPEEEDFRDILQGIGREIELVYVGVNSEVLGDFCLILVE